MKPALMTFLLFLVVVFSANEILAQENKPEGPHDMASPDEGAPVQSSLPPSSRNENTSDQEIDIRLRNLEEKINSLKDKVFRAKQRLAILQETVLSGALAGSRCSIEHRNEVGAAFEIVSILYYLDESPIFKWVEGSGEVKNEVIVFDGSVVPGPHHLSVYLVYRGKGYGFFSYLRGYTFKLKAGYSFNVEEGQLVTVTATAVDRGALVKLDNRLYLSFDITKKAYEEVAGTGKSNSSSGSSEK